MKYPIYTFLLVALIWPASKARVYQTSDAVILEIDDFSGGKNKGRTLKNDLDAPIPAPESDETSKRVLPSGTFLMSERTCWTSQGQMGTCGSLRSCYPNIQLQYNFESLIFGGRSTCVFTDHTGRQIYGVCCPNRQNAPFMQFPPGFQGGFPWWPTFFPGGQPGSFPGGQPGSFPVVGVHRPTTTQSPTTTSPWWVPESTTLKPSTTSPWWVPEGTTSPVSQQTTPAAVITTTQSSKPDQAKPSCGAGPLKILSVDEQERIVGGTMATKGSWRFIVALFNGHRHFCGGSLMDSEHILTAAHCIAHMSSHDLAKLEVALGMHTLKPVDTHAIRKKVRRVVRHKGFDSATLYNDVAILTLDSPIKYSSSIAPVCLPPAGTTDSYTSKEAAVVGWGALKEGGRQPEVLQQVTVKVQSNSQCSANYGKDAPGGIADHMICAAYPGRDSCSGDSGGPMITQSSPGAPWIQIGIVSWGIGCGKAPYPGVYSRVTSFMDWITKNSS